MKRQINLETIKLYWRQVRKYKPSFWAGFFAIPSASVFLDTLLPLTLSLAVGTFTTGDSALLQTMLLLAAGAGVIGVILNTIGFQSLIHHESAVRADLTVDTLDNLLKKDPSFFANQKIGALTGRFIDFINAHVGLQDLLVIRTLTFVLNMTLGVVILFINAPVLGLIVLALIVGLLLQVRFSLKLRSPLRNARKKLIGQVNGMAADTISNNLTVKTFANEEYELQKNRDISELYRNAYKKDFKWMALEGSGRLLLMSAVQIITIAIIAGLLSSGAIELGIAVFVIAYLQRIASQLFILGEMVNGYDKLLLEAAPITEMLIEPPKITDHPDAKKLAPKGGEIIFDQVDFAYSDAPDIPVLSDINLTIKPGERIGLVGSSGAGKTTITKLLMRFSEVTGGKITIDGQDISRVTQTSLRQAIAFVPQEPLLFHRSIRENILYGKLDATDEEVQKALRAANAESFIANLPEGIDTIVGERGVKLSGGQRQRIAIARAILKDAPILVLDEATSALDSESEKLIQDSLDSLMRNRTSIVIAHRLSTISKLDRIVVINNGRVAEAGTHQELTKNSSGIYAKLWRHQSGGFIEE